MVSAYVLAEVTLCLQADMARANSFSLPGIHFQCLVPRKTLSTSIDCLEHVIYIYFFLKKSEAHTHLSLISTLDYFISILTNRL